MLIQKSSQKTQREAKTSRKTRKTAPRSTSKVRGGADVRELDFPSPRDQNLQTMLARRSHGSEIHFKNQALSKLLNLDKNQEEVSNGQKDQPSQAEKAFNTFNSQTRSKNISKTAKTTKTVNTPILPNSSNSSLFPVKESQKEGPATTPVSQIQNKIDRKRLLNFSSRCSPKRLKKDYWKEEINLSNSKHNRRSEELSRDANPHGSSNFNLASISETTTVFKNMNVQDGDSVGADEDKIQLRMEVQMLKKVVNNLQKEIEVLKSSKENSDHLTKIKSRVLSYAPKSFLQSSPRLKKIKEMNQRLSSQERPERTSNKHIFTKNQLLVPSKSRNSFGSQLSSQKAEVNNFLAESQDHEFTWKDTGKKLTEWDGSSQKGLGKRNSDNIHIATFISDKGARHGRTTAPDTKALQFETEKQRSIIENSEVISSVRKQKKHFLEPNKLPQSCTRHYMKNLSSMKNGPNLKKRTKKRSITSVKIVLNQELSQKVLVKGRGSKGALLLGPRAKELNSNMKDFIKRRNLKRTEKSIEKTKREKRKVLDTKRMSHSSSLNQNKMSNFRSLLQRGKFNDNSVRLGTSQIDSFRQMSQNQLIVGSFGARGAPSNAAKLRVSSQEPVMKPCEKQRKRPNGRGLSKKKRVKVLNRTETYFSRQESNKMTPSHRKRRSKKIAGKDFLQRKTIDTRKSKRLTAAMLSPIKASGKTSRSRVLKRGSIERLRTSNLQKRLNAMFREEDASKRSGFLSKKEDYRFAVGSSLKSIDVKGLKPLSRPETSEGGLMPFFRNELKSKAPKFLESSDIKVTESKVMKTYEKASSKLASRFSEKNISLTSRVPKGVFGGKKSDLQARHLAKFNRERLKTDGDADDVTEIRPAKKNIQKNRKFAKKRISAFQHKLGRKRDSKPLSQREGNKVKPKKRKKLSTASKLSNFKRNTTNKKKSPSKSFLLTMQLDSASRASRKAPHNRGGRKMSKIIKKTKNYCSVVSHNNKPILEVEQEGNQNQLQEATKDEEIVPVGGVESPKTDFVKEPLFRNKEGSNLVSPTKSLLKTLK